MTTYTVQECKPKYCGMNRDLSHLCATLYKILMEKKPQCFFFLFFLFREAHDQWQCKYLCFSFLSTLSKQSELCPILQQWAKWDTLGILDMTVQKRKFQKMLFVICDICGLYNYNTFQDSWPVPGASPQHIPCRHIFVYFQMPCCSIAFTYVIFYNCMHRKSKYKPFNDTVLNYVSYVEMQ